MEAIRSQLPDDLKEHAEKCLENCDVEPGDIEIAKQQILHDLPDEIKDEIDIDSVLPTAESPPTQEEQKSMVLAALPEEFHEAFEQNAEKELVGG
ncbi:hypothetical protein [Arenicella xantha]|uniref:Uncharacterized protein n=1 Tax=Arenicella xantha TaxID=644221 RepID=A0A395JIH1_9GAMM|nr:hypothetical protein [Arenicella xantha]RBP49930.1 hypothetical protein DFR28_103362 [Arenicella xantha]